MIDALAIATVLTCAGSAVWTLVAVTLGRYRWRAAVPALVVIQAALLLQATLDVAGVVGGRHLAEPATHLAYVGASLVVLPVAATQVSREKETRWGGILLAVALLVLAVIVVRMQATWRLTGR